MKLKLGVLCALLLAGANAMACYTVYDASGRVAYRGLEAPVDMSLPLHQALEQARFTPGSSIVFDQAATCTPVSVAQVARPTGPNVPVNTIRLERTGRQISPSSAAPLLTDRETAQRAGVPYTQFAGDVVMVPPGAANRIDMSTVTVVHGDTSVARASGPDTTAMGAGPAREGRTQTVITEMRDPPVTIIQRGGSVSVQR
jgi:hypothetical protein